MRCLRSQGTTSTRTSSPATQAGPQPFLHQSHLLGTKGMQGQEQRWGHLHATSQLWGLSCCSGEEERRQEQPSYRGSQRLVNRERLTRDQPEGRTLPQGQSPTASIFSLDLRFKSKLGKAGCGCLFLMQGHGDVPGGAGSMEVSGSCRAPTELRCRCGGGLGKHNGLN